MVHLRRRHARRPIRCIGDSREWTADPLRGRNGEPDLLMGGHRVPPRERRAPSEPAVVHAGTTGAPRRGEGSEEVYVVDFTDVSTVGLESSPVAPALAGLRANEARYFKNKYGHDFTVEPASEARAVVDRVARILKEERGIVIGSPALEATEFQVENIRWAYVFYESGLSINVLYTLDDGGKRAVGFKLSDGMDVPEELSQFKFARQRSKLAGTIRGSYFVLKNEY
jgi:hypothetical protein